MMSITHLAIPAKDLGVTKDFYEKLGAEIGREYDTHIVMNFYGIQLVPHKAEEIEGEPKMYPRHFGIILDSHAQLQRMWDHLKAGQFIFAEYFKRHENKMEEHHTFFLKDPSNNVIEFKWYKNKMAIFGK